MEALANITARHVEQIGFLEFLEYHSFEFDELDKDHRYVRQQNIQSANGSRCLTSWLWAALCSSNWWPHSKWLPEGAQGGYGWLNKKSIKASTISKKILLTDVSDSHCQVSEYTQMLPLLIPGLVGRPEQGVQYVLTKRRQQLVGYLFQYNTV